MSTDFRFTYTSTRDGGSRRKAMHHPIPRFPVHPVLSTSSFRGSRDCSLASVAAVGPALRFTSGRYGLAKALMLSGVKQSTEVLLPAYSCPAMVSPIRWLGAEPRFYRVHPDLSIDLEDLSRRINPGTRCVIAVHYFGFLQDLAPLRRLCNERNLMLIEDCAHSLYGRIGDKPVGSVGDFAVASLMKFFPIYDGGCLVSALGFELAPALRRAGMGFQLKALVNVFERSHAYRRLPFRHFWDLAFLLKRNLLRAVKSGRAGRSVVAAPGSLDGGYEFEGDWMDVEMSWPSAALLSLVSAERCAQSRRWNYLRLLANLDDVPGGQALYRDLPATVVPYVFPFFVENPKSIFPALKQRGVPLLRWEHAETTACPVSASYSQNLLLLPCHQEMDAEDLDWVSMQIREVLVSDRR